MPFLSETCFVFAKENSHGDQLTKLQEQDKDGEEKANVVSNVAVFSLDNVDYTHGKEN